MSAPSEVSAPTRVGPWASDDRRWPPGPGASEGEEREWINWVRGTRLARSHRPRSEFRQRVGRAISTVEVVNSSYRLQPIDAALADHLRAVGGIRYVADAKPGYPCRHCLHDAEIGDVVVLATYDPFDIDSPYRSRSPIFVHEVPCPPPADLGVLPDQLTARQLSVRAFDGAAMMLDADVIAGTDLDDTLHRMFDNPGVDEIHIHNATRGCWATTATRTH